MDIDKIKQSLIDQGYTTIYDYDDVPGEYFADHSHSGDEYMFIIDGGMKVLMDGKEHLLKKGDELFFPAEMIHNALMDGTGCKYIVGEKPKKGYRYGI
jgi:quercetin dioxygenase-like cupin family protein